MNADPFLLFTPFTPVTLLTLRLRRCQGEVVVNQFEDIQEQEPADTTT